MIKIIAVGKIKEKNIQYLIDEYLKRVIPYHQVSIVEVKDYPNYDSDVLNKESLEKEAKLIKKNIKDNEYPILLDLKGTSYSSEQLARKIEYLFLSGESKLVFIIGGSLGVTDEIRKLAKETIKLSDFTFPHGLARLLLMEQLYRCFKIINHEPYHK